MTLLQFDNVKREAGQRPPRVDVPKIATPPRRRIRLLYLLPAEAFGGAERQGVEHIRLFPSFGIDVTALVGPGTAIIDALHDAGVSDYVHIDDFPSAGPNRAAWAATVGAWYQWARVSRRCVQTVLRFASAAPYDVVLANRSIAWPLGGIIAKHLGIPYLIRAGGRPSNPLTRPAMLALRLAYPPPSALVANCEAVRTGVAPWFDCPSYVVPNGVDLARFASREPVASRAALGLPAGRPVIGMAARPSPEKGLDLLARAARLTLRTHPDALFAVAGEHVTRGHYEQLVRSLGLAEHFRFLGHVRDVATFYSCCDVVVLTSPEVSIEGSPNALLEAMAASRPIVATRVGGIPELVRDGTDGLLVGPRDAEGFAEALSTLLEWPTLRSEMGQAGRHRAEASMSAQRSVARLAEIVETCVGASPRSAMASTEDRAEAG